MDKSRNNELHLNSTKRKLIAIEKNGNVLEKSKSSYVRRSMYLTKYKEYPIDYKCDIRKKGTSCTHKQFSLFNWYNKYSLPKSHSMLSNSYSKHKLPIVSKANNSVTKLASSNMRPKSKQHMQNDKQRIHDLFLTAKLKNNCKGNLSKETNNKCLIYIEDLLNKRKQETNTNKTLIALSKETEKDQRLFYYDLDLPSRYMNHSVYQTSIRPKEQREKSVHSSSSSAIKIKYCDKLLHSISRKITVYNDKNEYIGEEEVANKLHDEACNKKTNANTQEKPFSLKDFEINSEVVFPHSNGDSRDKEAQRENRVIKSEHKSKSSTSLYKRQQFPQQDDIGKSNRKFNKEEEESKKESNRHDRDESSNDYMSMNYSLNSLTLRYMSNFLIHSPLNGNSIIAKTPPPELLNNEDLIHASVRVSNKSNDDSSTLNKKTKGSDIEIQDTVRTLEKIHPKGQNHNIVIKPIIQSLQGKEDNSTINRKYIDIQKRYHDLASYPNSSQGSVMQQQLKEACMKTIFGNSSSVKNYLNNISILSCTSKSPIITKIKRKANGKKKAAGYTKPISIEEAKAKQEDPKSIEEIIDDEEQQQKIITEQERISQLNEDYQRFVRMKMTEEERIRQKKEAKEAIEEIKQKKTDAKKPRYLGSLNMSNQESLLTHCLLPKTPIKKSMLLKKDFLLGSHIDIALVKKKIAEKDKKKEQEEEDIEKTFNVIRKESNEEEKNEMANKRLALLKLKQEINYVLQEGGEDLDDKAKDNYTNDDNGIDNNKKAFNEFKGKLESLRNFNEQAYVQYLENNFEEIQEEMENMKQIRDEENRINSFLRDMDYSLFNTREKQKCLRSHFKIIDPKCSYSTSTIL